MLDADGEADERIGDADVLSRLFGDGGVGHGGWVAAEGFDAAETFGFGEIAESFEELEGLLEADAEVGGDDAGASAHLLLGDAMLGVRL